MNTAIGLLIFVGLFCGGGNLQNSTKQECSRRLLLCLSKKDETFKKIGISEQLSAAADCLNKPE